MSRRTGNTSSRTGRSVSVVFPCLDEAQSVAQCVTAARDGLRTSGLTGEILVVDNGSSDGSDRIAREAGARVISAPIRGYGSALQTGFREAQGDIIVMADADNQHDMTRLGELVQPIIEDRADLVLGSRLQGGPRGAMPILHRLVGTPLISFLLRRATGGLRIKDSQSGYRAFRANDIRKLNLESNGMEFASEMLLRANAAGLRVTEIPVPYRRRIGESKLRTFPDGWRHLQLIVMLAPQLLLFWPGIVMLALGTSLSLLSLLNPAGIQVGGLSWQPIFFGPILLVLGALSTLSGMILAHHSPLTRDPAARAFPIVGGTHFATQVIGTGSVLLTAGVLLELVLFSNWITGDVLHSRRLAAAGLAQALILMGAVASGFGLMYGLVRAGGNRGRKYLRQSAEEKAESADG